MKNPQGFTLIELMVSIAIIVILASAASVKAGKQLAKARDGKALAIVGSWRTANYLTYTDVFSYALTFEELRNKVDSQTINLTYGTSTGGIFTGSSTQWIQAGKSSNEKNMVSISITGSSIGSIIVFDSTNGNDSNDNLWSTY